MKKDASLKNFSTDDEVKETTLKWLREIGRKFIILSFVATNVHRYSVTMLRCRSWLSVYVGNKRDFSHPFLFFFF
ncbi:hypothetical protein WH47_06025 [Habropoda laboriosa]|uniref:Uncharacterized protein n=1 Tax=Habropoda laboriosa TaxID=597456 RepID=A0A0L7QRV1_9HYME|nr:hypothetical protein WH47_06025 [Habropoda laboriosa]